MKKCEIAEKIDIKSVYDLHGYRTLCQFPPSWIHPKIWPYTGVIVPLFIEFNGENIAKCKAVRHYVMFGRWTILPLVRMRKKFCVKKSWE